MSSAGRAANSNGCVARPKGRETGLLGFAAQIQRSSLIGSCAMETAEHREPCESRGSRTVLGARGGEIPPRDSTIFGADLLFSKAERLATLGVVGPEDPAALVVFLAGPAASRLIGLTTSVNGGS